MSRDIVLILVSGVVAMSMARVVITAVVLTIGGIAATARACQPMPPGWPARPRGSRRPATASRGRVGCRGEQGLLLVKQGRLGKGGFILAMSQAGHDTPEAERLITLKAATHFPERG